MNISGIKLILGFFLAIGFMLISVQSTSAAVSSWQKGATVNPRWDTDYGSETFKRSIDQLASTNANYVTMVIPWYQSNLYSTDIQRGGNTPTDASLIAGIQYAKSKGLQVMLKPHLESYSGQWRAYINPSDRQGWFTAYGDMLKHYAQIAKDQGVSALCIGAELINMSSQNTNSTNTQNWNALIGQIRSIYSGSLTYSANWGPSGFVDEKNAIGFWGSLDYVGISGYFNLDTWGNDVESLKAAWAPWVRDHIDPLAHRTGKPILFTEIGYKSITNAHREPWNWSYGGPVDETEQANAYEAFFQVFNNKSYAAGVHWWEWITDANAGGPGNGDYTPQRKKAQQTMTTWYGTGGTTAPPTTPPPSTVTCGSPGTGTFIGCYFENADFTNPVLTRSDANINFDWGNGSPDPKIGTDSFSVRWEGNFNFDAGEYTFTATTDDGMRVYVNNQLVINQWYDQAPTTHTAKRNMTAGTHQVKVEYYENGGGATAKASWTRSGTTTPTPPPSTLTCPAAGSGSFTGCYFNSMNFTNLAGSRSDSAINFDWGNGSPMAGVNADNFSVRWQGNFNFDAGEYTFTATGDDGIRVYVDNVLVIDQWKDQGPTTYTASRAMTAGSHAIKMEFYENGGGAVARLSWAKNSTGGNTPSPPPTSDHRVEIWWPTNGVSVSGDVPFKAIATNLSLDQYDMFWQVDGGGLVPMYNSQQDYPHKEFLANLSGWNWKGNGPYRTNFVAKLPDGSIIAQQSVDITVSH